MQGTVEKQELLVGGLVAVGGADFEKFLVREFGGEIVIGAVRVQGGTGSQLDIESMVAGADGGCGGISGKKRSTVELKLSEAQPVTGSALASGIAASVTASRSW